MARRNWIILALLLVPSWLLASADFALGVLFGGLLVIFSYRRLQTTLIGLVDEPTRRMAKKTLWSTLFKLFALAALMAAILAFGKIHPIGLAVGLSVVVINLIWTTGRRLLSHKESEGP